MNKSQITSGFYFVLHTWYSFRSLVIILDMKKLNLVGQKFERLTVLKEAPSIGGRSAWECQCDCGTVKNIKTEELRSGGTKSCGCWNQEQRSLRAENMYSKRIKYSAIEATARKVWKNNYEEMLYEDFYTISQQNCHYCNSQPSNTWNIADNRSSKRMKDNGKFTYNGLDRLDSTKPHSKENCVACCKYCNYAKRERSVEEFKEWLIKTYKFFMQDQTNKFLAYRYCVTH